MLLYPVRPAAVVVFRGGERLDHPVVNRAGVIGAAVMVFEHTLSPAAVDRAIAALD
ncbi:hypothetical protein ACFXGT_30915 [Streptomyces sp. NPDC059352]|uniref:hypothetical protein n=1 Tax=Streptomyces sp. NPDC059352 TaxID=3346810 RepID=UPI0036950036